MSIKSIARARFLIAAAAAGFGVFSATPGYSAVVTMNFSGTYDRGQSTGVPVDGISPNTGLTVSGSLIFNSSDLSPNGNASDELSYAGSVTTFTATVVGYSPYSAPSVVNLFMSKTNYPGPNQYFEADAIPVTNVTMALDSSSSPSLFGSSADPGSFFSQTNLPGEFYLQDSSGKLVFDVSVNVSAVPEPSTWAMMILGFLGVGFVAYRKKNALRFA